jgi:hypothetical protein
MQIKKLGFPLSTLFQGKRVGLFYGSSRWRSGSRMGESREGLWHAVDL